MAYKAKFMEAVRLWRKRDEEKTVNAKLQTNIRILQISQVLVCAKDVKRRVYCALL